MCGAPVPPPVLTLLEATPVPSNEQSMALQFWLPIFWAFHVAPESDEI